MRSASPQGMILSSLSGSGAFGLAVPLKVAEVEVTIGQFNREGIGDDTGVNFTVDPYSKGAQVFTGSFNVTLGDGTTVQAQYLSDFCPFDPTSCD